ncbi:lipopolysaccharide biosynthesis protein [Shewanella sedimentimangrovi]|uniref:Oligosaccharide flippase family protein n=1 Tax=Shewanella sedimentimangrovi TaxID=2814293 RepID=A0ABX7QZJ4_9GAMM|nr:oligosaccharide flippase family protein [Shewanella sedimentimangrovi]QSX36035.1 oligosaccharide flippase family protein [Shewanella sedimentimangrovi]
MLKNVLKVLSGGVLAQALNFFSFPIIASWYGPATFGDYAIFAFFIAFMPMLMTLRMEMALMQDPDESEKNSLILLSLINSVSIFILGLLASQFFSEKIKIEIILVTFTSLLIAIQNMAISIANLKERYWVIAISRILFPIFFLLIIWLAKDHSVLFPLATSHMLSTMFVLGFILKASEYKVKLTSLTQMPVVLKKYENYVKFDLPSGALNASALLLPAYLIGMFFDEKSSGLYFLAFKLILSPLGTLTMAVGYVYRREAVKEYKENKVFFKSTQKMFLFLFLLAVMMLLAYYFMGPTVFGIFFKEDWLAALPIISVLMPMFALKLVASPLSFSFYIVDKLKLDLYGQLLFIVSSVLAIYIGYLLGDFIKAVYFIAISSGLVYLIYAVMSIQFSKGKVA